MEAKKTPKADLQKSRALFMEIGLVVALLFVVGAFAVGQSEKKVDKIDMVIAPIDTDVVLSTKEDVKPPEVKIQEVQILSDFIKVVKNETRISTDYEFTDFGDDIVIEPPKIQDKAEEIPVFVAEQMPSFRGGDLNTFRSWATSQLVYPRLAQENNVTGKVVLKFVIEADGRLTNIEEISSPDKLLTDEAIRVLKMSPKWTPGKNRNRAVRVYFIMPIDFVLTTG